MAGDITQKQIDAIERIQKHFGYTLPPFVGYSRKSAGKWIRMYSPLKNRGRNKAIQYIRKHKNIYTGNLLYEDGDIR